jgi:hypothetical protein
VSEADREGLVKIWIDLPDDPETGSESFWALPLGNDLYEVRNNLFAAYDLHYLDVVRAVPRENAQKPEVLEIIRRSGHKTLRVIFHNPEDEVTKRRVLRAINAMGARFENANGRLYSIDVPPESDYQAVCDSLWREEAEGKTLTYETGISREDDPLLGSAG